jgi:hypothetical protein
MMTRKGAQLVALYSFNMGESGCDVGKNMSSLQLMARNCIDESISMLIRSFGFSLLKGM